MGSKPRDAFAVSVGRVHDDADDILNGFLRVAVMVAMMLPAEFIVLTIEQRMQAAAV